MMQLEDIYIHNYKSLREVTIHPGNLNCFVGPNGAGKSNIFDALSFLNDVYNEGLQQAILNKGGYDNILFRSKRKSKNPIHFSATFKLPITPNKSIKITHSFAIKSEKESIDSEIKIHLDSLTISTQNEVILHIRKSKNSPENREIIFNHELGFEFISGLNLLRVQPSNMAVELTLPKNELSLSPYTINTLFNFQKFPKVLFESFNLSAHLSRQRSVPTSIEKLNSDGTQLAMTLYRFKNTNPIEWLDVLETLQEVIPALRDISIKPDADKQLRIEFSFVGFTTKPFQAHEVSDGTILLLGSLLAIASSKAIVVCLDEPENSLHPWGIDTLMDFIKRQSEKKAIFIATQNLRVLDNFSPDQIFCVYQEKNGTTLKLLSELDANIQAEWEEGNLKVSEVFTTGLIPQTVPKYDEK